MSLLQRASRTTLFRIGLVLFVFGSGPLLMVMVAATLGLTTDPDPNPVYLGILAGFTFWPSIILMAISLLRARRPRP